MGSSPGQHRGRELIPGRTLRLPVGSGCDEDGPERRSDPCLKSVQPPRKLHWEIEALLPRRHPRSLVSIRHAGGRSAARALLGAMLLLGTGCGPWGPQGILPGGPFLGDADAGPVADWSFTDAHMLIGIETRGRWFRHSVTILCVAADGTLYVMARHAPTKRWVRDVGADPRVRLRIGDRLYEGRAVRILEGAEADAVARAFLRKYVGIEAPEARALPGPVSYTHLTLPTICSV